MITKKFRFSIATNFVRSEWTEDVELEFDDDTTPDEIISQVDEIYTEWLFDKNRGSWTEIN